MYLSLACICFNAYVNHCGLVVSITIAVPHKLETCILLTLNQAVLCKTYLASTTYSAMYVHIKGYLFYLCINIELLTVTATLVVKVIIDVGRRYDVRSMRGYCYTYQQT